MWMLFFLFLEFAKIGLFSVGGGLATLPFLYDLAERSEWLSTSDIATMIAISESTPGPMGINMATYVGYIHKGIMGAIATPLGEVLPSIIIILIIAKFLQKFKESQAFKDVFYGLRPASVAMIVTAGLSIFKLAFFGETDDNFFWQGGILAVLIFIAMKKFKLHPVVYIGISAVAGVVLGYLM